MNIHTKHVTAPLHTVISDKELIFISSLLFRSVEHEGKMTSSKENIYIYLSFLTSNAATGVQIKELCR